MGVGDLGGESCGGGIVSRDEIGKDTSVREGQSGQLNQQKDIYQEGDWMREEGNLCQEIGGYGQINRVGDMGKGTGERC